MRGLGIEPEQIDLSLWISLCTAAGLSTATGPASSSTQAGSNST